jgi:hypothetical protein
VPRRQLHHAQGHDLDPAAQTTFDLDAREVRIATALNDANRFDAALRAAGWKSERLSD